MAAAAAAAEAFSTIFSSDSEGTLGSFAVHFGRRFGTKLGGVLVQKSCVSGMARWRLWSSLVAAAAAAAVAEVDCCVAFFYFFLAIQKGR